MKYAHLFWELFGCPVTAWDALSYGDFLWMKAAADDHQQQQKEAAKK